MSKKLRREQILIAPDIVGWLDENYSPKVIDLRNDQELNPRDINNKIMIYERQVNDWFLIPATNLVKYRNKNKGFIVLMICLSYLEGVEQYKEGRNSNGNSRRFFISAVKKLYPGKFHEHELIDFYSEARCGLFHNGMVKGKILINYNFPDSLEFSNGDIKISPSKLLRDIKADFQSYINALKTDDTLRSRFDNMYSNI